MIDEQKISELEQSIKRSKRKIIAYGAALIIAALALITLLVIGFSSYFKM